jgi:Tat protein secretion system quality control protein TatD with DNase activity
LETDSPVTYRRGTEFEFDSRPADVVRTLDAISEIKNIDRVTAAKITLENAVRLFNL